VTLRATDARLSDWPAGQTGRPYLPPRESNQLAGFTLKRLI